MSQNPHVVFPSDPHITSRFFEEEIAFQVALADANRECLLLHGVTVQNYAPHAFPTDLPFAIGSAEPSGTQF
jgi:hypothetical protein